MLELSLSEIKKIEGAIYNDDSYISLSQGALKVGGIPPLIKQHITHLMQTDETDYYKSAWGITPLREKIANKLNQRYNSDIKAENVIVSHGSIGALTALFSTLTQQGDEIIIPEPAYPAYTTLCEFARCTPVYVANRIVDNQDKLCWDFDLQAIHDAITPKTKFIVVSNPCNPTGNVLSKETLAQLIKLCEENNIYFISDEVYEDYLFNTSFYSATSYVTQSEWVIRAGSFSKNYSMSGWRVGYMIVPQHLATALGRMQDAQLNCPNVFAQHAALFALDHPELVTSNYEKVRASLDIAHTLLTPLVEQEIIWYAYPNAGFNLFVNAKKQPAAQLVQMLREQAKVTLVPGKAFGPSGTDFFRLCYARRPEVVERGVTRIVKMMGHADNSICKNHFTHVAR